MEKVDIDSAIIMIDKWLDYKKIKPKKRESLKSMYDNLVDAVVTGQLTLNEENYELKYELDFPLGNDESIKHFTFKPRINDAELERHRRGIKGDDFTTQMWVTLCGLTNQALGIVKALDSTDKSVAESIALFFM